MADVLLGSSEHRVLISGGGYGLPPESLLCRLDQIDLRLRLLEEQRRPSADDGDAVRRAPQHQHTKSLPSALQLKGTLMDRLNMLETRIRQLSCELDLDPAAGNNKNNNKAAAAAGSLGLGITPSSVPPAEEHRSAWSESAPMLEPCRDPAVPMMRAAPTDKSVAAAADGSWSTVEILQKGTRQLHRNKPINPSNKVKSLKEAKCACQKEKKKAERNSTRRRWFGVGC